MNNEEREASIDEFKGKNKEIRSGIFWISMNTMKKRDKLMIE